QHAAYAYIHHTHHIVIAKLGFGLPFKLWLRNLHRDDGAEPLAEVITGDLNFGPFKQLVLIAIRFEYTGDSAAETGYVRTPFYGIDVVYVGKYRLAVRAVVGKRYIH